MFRVQRGSTELPNQLNDYYYDDYQTTKYTRLMDRHAAAPLIAFLS